MNIRRAAIVFSVAAIGFTTIALAMFNHIEAPDPTVLDLIETRVCALARPNCPHGAPSTVPTDPDGKVRIMVYTSSIRREACSAALYRTFANIATGEVVYRVMAAGGKVPVSKDGNPVEFPMPFELSSNTFPKGTYGYHAVSYSRCVKDGKIRESVATTNLATFTVE